MENVNNPEENNENPLKELLISQTEFNRGELLEVLRNFIRVDIETGQIIPISDYAYLTTWQQIVVMLLGTKALKALGKRDGETMSPKELSEMSGINYNSVRSYLSQLCAKKMVAKASSEYYIPNYNIEKIRLELIKSGRRDS